MTARLCDWLACWMRIESTCRRLNWPSCVASASSREASRLEQVLSVVSVLTGGSPANGPRASSGMIQRMPISARFSVADLALELGIIDPRSHHGMRFRQDRSPVPIMCFRRTSGKPSQGLLEKSWTRIPRTMLRTSFELYTNDELSRSVDRATSSCHGKIKTNLR